MIRIRKSKTVRRAGRGSVIVIAALLLSSAAIRLTTGGGVAFAEGVGNGKVPPMIQKAEPVSATHLDHAETAPKQEVGEDVGGLLAALQARETRLRERERQIEMRTKALAVADEEIEKRILVLAQAEEDLRKTLSLTASAAEDDLARLTSVYENMKPKDAAALFQAMEPEFAAGFLGRMRPDAAAAVMAGLTPEAAYSISVILAGRNANTPKT